MFPSTSKGYHYINLKDVNGNTCVFEASALNEQLIGQGLTIFGMALPVISRVRRELMAAGLPFNLTVEDVSAFFNYLQRNGMLTEGLDAGSEDKE